MIKICSSTSTIHYIPEGGKRLKKSELFRINEKLKRKISHLRGKLHDSNEEAIKLKSELNKMRKKFCSLKCQFKNYNETINDKDCKITALTEKCCQKSCIAKHLKCKCKEMFEKNNDLMEKSKNFVQMKNKQLKLISDKFQATQLEVQKLNKIISKESQKEAEMKLQQKKLCDKVDELHKNTEALKQKNETLHRKLDEKDALLNDIDCELKSFKSANCKQIKHLENKMQSLENDKSNLMNQINHAKKLVLNDQFESLSKLEKLKQDTSLILQIPWNLLSVIAKTEPYNDNLKNELKTVKLDNQNWKNKKGMIYNHLKLYLAKYEEGKAEKFKIEQECRHLKKIIRKTDKLVQNKTTDFKSLMKSFNHLKNHTKLFMNYAYRFLKKESSYRIRKDTFIGKINEKRQNLYNIIASQFEQVKELGFDFQKTDTKNDSFNEDSIDDCPCTF